jgi:hypothetical protein
MVLNELKQLPPKALANLQLSTSEDLAVFLKDRLRYVPASRFGHRDQHNCTLQTSRFDGSGDQHIGVDNKAKRQHYRLVLRERVVLMIWSIWPAVN